MSPRMKKGLIHFIQWRLKKAFMEKIEFERIRMAKVWDIYLFDGTPAILLNDIKQWENEITSEIEETFHHLKEEINEVIGQYQYKWEYENTANVKKINFNFDSIEYDKELVIFTTKASEYIENGQLLH